MSINTWHQQIESLRSLHNGMTEIDVMLWELENYPERFSSEFLSAVEETNLKSRLRTIRTEFEQIAEDIKGAPQL